MAYRLSLEILIVWVTLQVDVIVFNHINEFDSILYNLAVSLKDILEHVAHTTYFIGTVSTQKINIEYLDSLS